MPGDIILHKCTKNHEIWHVMDVIVIFHFGLYFSLYLTPLTVQKMKISKKWRSAWRYHHFTQVYQKSWSYAILFLWCVTGVIVILFWAIFLPFYPNNSPKNENFKKNEKKPRDIIILQNCTKNHDDMLYWSWHMAHDKCNYFSFWPIFCTFTPITARKVKLFKK